MSTREKTAFALVAIALVVVDAVFPRLTRWLRWPQGLGPRGRLAFTASQAATIFAALQWLGPWAQAEARRQDEIREQLRTELGCEPTHDEVIGRRIRRD